MSEQSGKCPALSPHCTSEVQQICSGAILILVKYVKSINLKTGQVPDSKGKMKQQQS